MPKSFCALHLFFCCVLALCAQESKAQNVRAFSLPSGLRIVLLKTPSSQVSAHALGPKRTIPKACNRMQNPRFSLMLRSFTTPNTSEIQGQWPLENNEGLAAFVRCLDLVYSPKNLAKTLRDKTLRTLLWQAMYPNGVQDISRTLAIVGDISLQETQNYLQEHFRGSATLTSGQKENSALEKAPEDVPKKTEIYQYTPQSHHAEWMLGFPITPKDARDIHSFQLLGMVLQRRLQEALRVRQSPAYDLRVELSAQRLAPGYIAVHVRCRAAELDDVIEEIHAELAGMSAITPKEYTQAQTQWTQGQGPLNLTQQAYLLARFGTVQAQNIDLKHVQSLFLEHCTWERASSSTRQPLYASPEARRRMLGVRKKRRRKHRK